MNCLRCGTEVTGTEALCPTCLAARRGNGSAPIQGRVEPGTVSPRLQFTGPSESVPCGFWLRVLAYTVNSALITLIASIVALFVLLLGGGFTVGNIAVLIGVWAFLSLGGWIAGVIFEASTLQASPGKLLLGIRVTDEHGERLTLARSFGRGFVKLGEWLFSGVTLGIPFLLAGFTSEKRALHDMICGTRVVSTPPVGGLKIALGIFLVIFSFITTAALPFPSANNEGLEPTAPRSDYSPLVSGAEAYPDTPALEDPELLEQGTLEGEAKIEEESESVPLAAFFGDRRIEFSTVNAKLDSFRSVVIVTLARPGMESAPDVAIRFKFIPGTSTCSRDTLEGYTVELYARPGGFVLPNGMGSLELSRIGSWRHSDELPGLDCELRTGGYFRAILQEATAKNFGGGGGAIPFGWSLGFGATLERAS